MADWLYELGDWGQKVDGLEYRIFEVRSNQLDLNEIVIHTQRRC